MLRGSDVLAGLRGGEPVNRRSPASQSTPNIPAAEPGQANERNRQLAEENWQSPQTVDTSVMWLSYALRAWGLLRVRLRRPLSLRNSTPLLSSLAILQPVALSNPPDLAVIRQNRRGQLIARAVGWRDRRSHTTDPHISS